MRVIFTVIVTLIVVAVLGAGFIYSGMYDVAAVHPDNPLVARLIHAASDRSIETRKDAVVVPAGYDAPDKAAAGAKIYAQTCVICHSGPGLKPSAVAAGINPGAPPLARAGRSRDPQEDFWVVANGIKMTAMPGFTKSLSEDDIWNIVAFLKTLPGMSAEEFAKETGLSTETAPGGKPDAGSAAANSSSQQGGGPGAGASSASAASGG
jgi:mono/diheme cytochrome c family protein